MFMRIVQMKINPEQLREFRTFYDQQIIPELQQTPGCLYACLMRSDQQEDECLSMTFWDRQEQAEAYERSGLFQRLLKEAGPYLSHPSEWRIQLSDDFTLEYEPVREEPMVQSYPVVAQSDEGPGPEDESQIMYMRIVSAKIQPGKREEFNRLYTDVIIPAFRAVKGCRYAYLTESIKQENEVLSVTIWDSKEAAEEYERSGLSDELTEKVKPTLSELYQWKMTLKKDFGRTSATSEDLQVDYFNVITGKKFK